jgi:glutamate racemase
LWTKDFRGNQMASAENHSIESMLGREDLTVLITDSGLGGLSIFAEIAARVKNDPIFSNLSLVYYNAWPDQNRGYNSLKDMDERVRVFDRALDGMKRYKPDIIMIACNTLSVLFDQTVFSQREKIPVVDIVQFGVDMVYENLTREADAIAVMLGTVTTIASNVHRAQLLERGIHSQRLVTQPCDQLATQIEKGPDSDVVMQMVEMFMDQAAEKLPRSPSQVAAALFCTHFGYCGDLIRRKLEERIQCPVTVLDPNRHMAEWMFQAFGDRQDDSTSLDMRVVSRIVWDRTKIDAIAGMVEKQSPETAEALKHYQHLPDLFTF